VVCTPRKNEKTGVALEAKAFGGDGFGVPAALVAITAAIEAITKLADNCTNALGHECQQLAIKL
jgi:hypothetical protein